MTEPNERWFYWSVRLMLMGLVVELLSLFGMHHPLGFLLFTTFGMSLIGVGVLMFLVFLLSLVRTGS